MTPRSGPQQEGTNDVGMAKRLWPYIRPYKRAVWLSVLLVPVLNGAQLIQPYLVKLAIDNHISIGVAEGLLVLGLVFFVALVVEFLGQYGQIYFLNYTGQGVVRDLRKDLFGHVLRLSPRFYDREPVGRLLTRTTNDLEGVSEMFASGIVTLLADVVKLLAITIILFSINTRLALVTMAVAPALYILVHLIRDELRTGFREVRLRIARLNGFLAEALSGMDIVQAFTQEKRISQEFAGLGRDYKEAAYKTIKYDAILYAIVEFFASVAAALILWYGGLRIIAGALSFGELVAFISYIQMFFNPIRDLSAKYATMQSGMASLERIFSLRDVDDRIPEPSQPQAATVTKPEPAAAKETPRGADIRYENVWFAYQNDDYVVRDLSLHAAPGEHIAFVGATGSGKSTTIKLLSRFYDPLKGAIYLDGTDIRAHALHDLRRRIGVVSQDVFLFSGTILDNIRLFDDSISRETVESACETVGLLPMLARLGKRLEEPVLERGRNFSQGQRQLMSFARVLAFNPDVLVLDEATSSVDQETEFLVQQAMQRVMEGRTSLVVAHRLATIQHADRIMVMHHGEVREAGTHRELIRLGGLYDKLYRLQVNGVES